MPIFLNMEYYQSETPIVLRAYGRCIQQMVDHLKATPDRELRTRMALETVRSMALINPAGKEMEAYQKKLWDHLYRIAGYDLDVDSPFPPPHAPALEDKPVRPSYQILRSKRRHYGRNVDLMIERAKTLEDETQRNAYVRQIASYMKLMTRLATTDPNAPDVSDAVVLRHLEEMSGGMLRLNHEEVQLAQGFKPTHITNQSAPVYQRRKKKKRTQQAFTQPATTTSAPASGTGGFRKKRRNKRNRNKNNPG